VMGMRDRYEYVIQRNSPCNNRPFFRTGMVMRRRGGWCLGKPRTWMLVSTALTS
jgi:hypothetical protein